MGIVNTAQLLQLVDNPDCWTLFTAVSEVHCAILLWPRLIFNAVLAGCFWQLFGAWSLCNNICYRLC